MRQTAAMADEPIRVVIADFVTRRRSLDAAVPGGNRAVGIRSGFRAERSKVFAETRCLRFADRGLSETIAEKQRTNEGEKFHLT